MNTSALTTKTLENLVRLSKKRDALRIQLSTIEDRLFTISERSKATAAPVKRGGKQAKPSGKPKAATKSRRKKSSGRRGALKEKILKALRAAGAKGVAVKDLSKKLGVKNQNVHVWFSSTGRSLGTIERIGSGKYRITASA